LANQLATSLAGLLYTLRP